MATACYAPEYLPGSFKGVPFESVEAGSEHGRRGAEGEFPFGEETAWADLGRRIRKYTLKVRFVENSHIADAQALIDACESVGPGPLAHPTRGIVQAACTSIKVSDEVLEGQGVTYADLEFVEANDWPAGLVTGGSPIGLVVSTIIDLARGVFLNNYRPLGAPQHRRGQVYATAAGQINTILGEYRRATVNSTDASVYRAASDLEFIASDEVSLSDPVLVDKALALGIAAVARQTAGDAKFQAMRRIANSATAVSTLPGIAGTSQDAVYALTRVVSGAFMAQAAMEAPYTTADAAFNYLDAAVAVLSGEADVAYSTCENELFVELRRFIVETQNAILTRAYNLPSLIQYRFNGSVHPLVAAYDIFDDARRHRELEIANLISPSGRFGPAVTGASA